jgi:hypothetical protein
MSDKTTKVQHTGGTAYPITALTSGVPWDGLTKRDYFAAAALTGIISISSEGGLTRSETAMLAYEIADAMLKAREA